MNYLKGSVRHPRLVLLLSASALALPGCALKPARPASETGDRAYVSYKAVPKQEGRLRLAVKDLIDVKGEVTSAGSEYVFKNSPPAQRDAACMAEARRRGVVIVGKTNLTEFAIGTSGINDYFGTPKNHLSRKEKLIPGGSSNGSAVAVANGTADVAFGSDTAGSIRTPAACCGIFGLKTTFGLVPLKGVFPLAQHLDTVGPMAADVPHLVKGMDLLKPGFAARYQAEVARHPSGRSLRVGRLYLPGANPEVDRAVDRALAAAHFEVVPLNEQFRKDWEEAKAHTKTVALSEGWLNLKQYLDKPGVSAPTKATILLGNVEYPTKYEKALAAQQAWQQELKRLFRRVDLIAVPTLQNTPPKVPFWGHFALMEDLVYNLQNTAAVNFAGNPAIAIPVPLADPKVPKTSVQLVGPRLSEARLVNAARLIAEAEHTAERRENGRKKSAR